MKVKAKKDFQSAITGNASSGDVMEVTDSFGRQLIEWGLATEVKPTAKKSPAGKTGAAKPSASSQAAPASPKKTVRKPRKKAGE